MKSSPRSVRPEGRSRHTQASEDMKALVSLLCGVDDDFREEGHPFACSLPPSATTILDTTQTPRRAESLLVSCSMPLTDKSNLIQRVDGDMGYCRIPPDSLLTTLPRLGSRVRIPSPAPDFLQHVKDIGRSIGPRGGLGKLDRAISGPFCLNGGKGGLVRRGLADGAGQRALTMASAVSAGRAAPEGTVPEGTAPEGSAPEGSAMETTMVKVAMVKKAKPKTDAYRNRKGEIRVRVVVI